MYHVYVRQNWTLLNGIVLETSAKILHMAVLIANVNARASVAKTSRVKQSVSC